MGRLIDEDDVIREIEKHKNHVKEGYVSRGVDDHGAVELYFLAHEHIKELIAVKVPSIGTCHECKHGTHSGRGDRYICTVSPELRMEHEGDFFCGYAERREDERSD